MLDLTLLPVTSRPETVVDAGVVGGYLEDASGAGPGTAAGLVRPADEAEAATFLRETLADGVRVLPQAARTSLTGGAIPHGDVVLSVERLDRIGPIESDGATAIVRVQPGVRLGRLQARLAEAGWYYPPVPTYQEAMVGGTVATNAGGAASFKYGVTRDWVVGLRVLLFNGELLEVRRGQAVVRRGERFRLRLTEGRELEVPAPGYRLPPLKKISAGYHAGSPLDLVDLFVGSEGTLGLITEIRLRLVRLPPATLSTWIPTVDVGHAFRVGADLRAAAERARARADPAGPDIRSIEFLDGSCLRLLEGSGLVDPDRAAGAALLVEMELSDDASSGEPQEALERFWSEPGSAPDVPLVRLLGILRDHGVDGEARFALPGEPADAARLQALREAAPQRVGEILARRKRDDPAIEKVGGDLIVPFEHLDEMLDRYECGFRRRGIESAVWGHFSDGNLHPNGLPRSGREVVAARETLREFADHAIRLGGAPLSEHGVGRHPFKQELLRRFLGEAAIGQMRAIKRALDPPGRFAPGVLFPAS